MKAVAHLKLTILVYKSCCSLTKPILNRNMILVKVSGLVRLFITEYKGKQREDLRGIRVLSGNQYAFTIWVGSQIAFEL